MKMMSLLNSAKSNQPVRRMGSLFLAGIALILFQAMTVQKAYAHHPIVTSAIPSCSNGQLIISYTVTSWAVDGPDGEGENTDVAVFFNGSQVGMGQFVDPTDAFSGQADAPNGVDTVTVSATAVANWGDTYPGGQNSNDFGTSMTVDLSTVGACAPPPGNGRFTGGGKVVVSNAIVPASGSVTVTKGFEVECDLDPAHENLELNWAPPTGANFHMDRITSAVCILSGKSPNPPTADVNRIDATGTGKYNGASGYTVVFTLWDHGEPGVNDEAGFTVCLTDPANPNACAIPGNIVLEVPLQPVSTGNIQAHLDQGH